MNRICSSAVHTHVNDCETEKKSFLENVNRTFNIQSPSGDDHVIYRFYGRTIGHCKRTLSYVRYSHNALPGIPVPSSLDELLLVLSIYTNQYNRSTNYTHRYVRNLRGYSPPHILRVVNGYLKGAHMTIRLVYVVLYIQIQLLQTPPGILPPEYYLVVLV